MFLVDTNIFLEILLEQDKKEDCEKFLDKNIGKLHITDFSLHSIGVILFKYDKLNIFKKFIEDILPNVEIITLPRQLYTGIIDVNRNLKLDFDDAYQYNVAQNYGLRVVTIDKDFKKINDKNILFL